MESSPFKVSLFSRDIIDISELALWELLGIIYAGGGYPLLNMYLETQPRCKHLICEEAGARTLTPT